jgi:hypothetical protein
MNSFLQGDYGSAPTSFATLFIAMLLAYLLGQLFAWVYMFTHSGISYSRSYVVALIIVPVLVALMLIVMENNVMTAFGLLGVFAIVRFRHVLRDTLDTCYLLTTIIIGLACGTQKFTTAIVGGVGAAGLMMFLWLTAAGTRHRFDLILNIKWTRGTAEMPELAGLLDRHGLRVLLANQHFGQGVEGADLSYRILLRDPRRASELMSELAALPGVERVSSVQAADESEI